MKRFVLWTIMVMILLAGCAGNETNTAASKPLPPTHRPTLEEIQQEYELNDFFEYEDAPIVLIEDDLLWEQMHIQIVAYQNERGYLAVYAVTEDCESNIEIKPYWGSYTFDYVLTDINEDGYTEMIGFYDWGSGIVRSIPFVLKHTGEFADLTARDEEPMSMYLYEDFRLAEDSRSVIASACEELGSGGDKQLRIFFNEGKYYYEYH